MDTQKPGNGAPYYLYINFECVGEYDDYFIAKKDANFHHTRYPDDVIDINDNTDENSVYGFN